MVESSGIVVLENRTGRDRARHLHISAGFEAEVDALHPPLQQEPEGLQVGSQKL